MIFEHTNIINELIRLNNYKSYLEIGVGDPTFNLLHIDCEKKTAVDPYFDLYDVEQNKPSEEKLRLINENVKYRITSDEFFSLLSENVKYDLIFIDGLHTEEQCDKDIRNALSHVSDGGIIIVHDTNPYEEESITRITPGDTFNGDVYKSISKLKDTGIKYFTLGDDYGITAIKPSKQFNKAYIVPKYLDLPYAEFVANRDSLLNLVSREDFLKMAKNQKSLLCCIAKQENLYLRDFIEYYKKLGFTNIVLYDNNDINGEYPQQVIGDYISSGFVIYKDVRGKYRCQLDSYSECYQMYRQDYDWIAFFDIDEYLEIGGKTISEFLTDKKYLDAEAIYLYWKVYGDNELLHYDPRPVYDRFQVANTPKADLNNYKVILRCYGDNLSINFTDANSFKWTRSDMNKFIAVNADGKDITYENPYASFTYKTAYIKHYITLTIDEFLCRRFGRRSYADTASSFNKEMIMEIFYSTNKMTAEKQRIINEFFNNFEFEPDNV